MIQMGIKAEDASRLSKLIRNAGKVTVNNLDSVQLHVQGRTVAKLVLILDNVSHPLHD